MEALRQKIAGELPGILWHADCIAAMPELDDLIGFWRNGR